MRRWTIDALSERVRQEELRLAGKFRSTCATMGEDQMTEAECFTVLGEEVGEVGRAICEGWKNGDGSKHLREELIQVIAVAGAWVERLDAMERAEHEQEPTQREVQPPL